MSFGWITTRTIQWKVGEERLAVGLEAGYMPFRWKCANGRTSRIDEAMMANTSLLPSWWWWCMSMQRRSKMKVWENQYRRRSCRAGATESQSKNASMIRTAGQGILFSGLLKKWYGTKSIWMSRKMLKEYSIQYIFPNRDGWLSKSTITACQVYVRCQELEHLVAGTNLTHIGRQIVFFNSE